MSNGRTRVEQSSEVESEENRIFGIFLENFYHSLNRIRISNLTFDWKVTNFLLC